MKNLLVSFFVASTMIGFANQPADHLVFQGDASKPGKNKHIVLIAGDEEYRSEESMPMMAQILAKQGFQCTVLFSMDKNNKFVNPDALTSLSNPTALDSADAIILDTRMRKWSDATMEKFNAAWKRGTPFTALRTATHPFQFPKNSKWHQWSWNYKSQDNWNGGWGRKVLGETWVSHWGRHGHQGTRTYAVEANKNHPILNGVGTIFGKTDLYEANPLAPSTVLLDGQITQSLDKASPDLKQGRGNKRMPVAWTRLYKHEDGTTNRIFTTTMGSADDLIDENLRRLVINSVYWGLELDVPAKANADLQNTYEPSFFGFRTFKKGKTPTDFLNVLSAARERAMERAKKFNHLKGKPGDVRFIRIELEGAKKILTLAEVEAISGGKNIAPKGIPKQSSTYEHGHADKAIDLNKSQRWNDKTQTHTLDANGGTRNPWWELDLQHSYELSEVRIWNRAENFGQRLEDFKITLLDKDRKVLFTKSNILAPTEAISILPATNKTKYSKGTVSGKTPQVKIDGPNHASAVKGNPPSKLTLAKNSRIAFVGGGLGSRMNKFNAFEAHVQASNPGKNLYIRNLCKEGDTPAFRPHPSRKSFVVLDSLEDKGQSLIPKEFRITRGDNGDTWGGKNPGHYETPDQWLTRHSIDTVIGFFGYTESFHGTSEKDLNRYKDELRAFIKHTLSQTYTNNGPQLAIVGPAAFEQITSKIKLPEAKKLNDQIAAYTQAMAEVCKEEGILFFDTQKALNQLYAQIDKPLTVNGHNLNAEGYAHLAPILTKSLFGSSVADKNLLQSVKKAVADKNRLWLNDYKMPNGVHAHGTRYSPFGNVNYPHEFKKIRQLTEIRDKAIWRAAQGNPVTGRQLASADAKTHTLPKVETNRPNLKVDYLTGKKVERLLQTAPGYKVELFACERQFPDLQNPSQMAFDNQGRLWVGCMSTYPHYRIGDPAANDKILILEDTNNDGKADRQITFVENIHIPMGFEITEHGVFVSLGNDLVLFEDTNGDSKADKKTIVLSGFDDHDTHHAISSFCADPSGAIYMGEGVFSFSNVETPYGTVRGSNGGFFRYNPNKGHLERTAQYQIPNPWGIAFNEWGQNFFLHTSGAPLSWMQQTATKPRYNINPNAPNLLKAHNVRPTSGLEFVSSRHFPDEVQGDVLICNNIGFLGCKQHKVEDDPESGFFKTSYRHDLFQSPKEYRNFRPVDLEFAPDGSLYFIDWANVLIGHMQHSARDPKRDHRHGRVYRVTYPSRPLVKPAKIVGATINELLENLKLHEYRTRYRTRRELRGRDRDAVARAVAQWAKDLDPKDNKYEHHLLEALWVTWGIEQINQDILQQLLQAKDYRARAAAVRALRYNAEEVGISETRKFLVAAAGDTHAQVRHEALIACTWLDRDTADQVISTFEKQPHEKWWSDQALIHAKAGDRPLPPAPKFPKHKGGIVKNDQEETVIAINAVQGLKFDVKTLNLAAGKKVKLIFSNPDEMPHNLLVVKPGTIDSVAAKAIAMGGDGFEKHFVPEDDNIIVASKLLNHHEEQTLEMTINQPGTYHFVCTFPGHDKMMRGEFVVK